MENLTLKEKIDRAKDGRTQTWILQKMRESGVKMSDSAFSRKKNGLDKFHDYEIKLIEKILKVKL
ncbi:MAG: hypothetical protein IM591_13920 [Chitinophagaceae bacterium]|jgi:hypothetical protein|uniref:hypothetical protein n=1 Tax=Microcystis sp. M061S2 TaxID=2771171 RepID=UPI0025904547|nr:hypothetical protein [Microcystis sp. M061S2]MCA2656620.1 hypothetical protein [Microcystis sp. M061S2]MCA6471474.1 hypothetical protein [Chitinophagaceae bacterium]